MNTYIVYSQIICLAEYFPWSYHHLKCRHKFVFILMSEVTKYNLSKNEDGFSVLLDFGTGITNLFLCMLMFFMCILLLLIQWLHWHSNGRLQDSRSWTRIRSRSYVILRRATKIKEVNYELQHKLSTASIADHSSTRRQFKFFHFSIIVFYTVDEDLINIHYFYLLFSL